MYKSIILIFILLTSLIPPALNAEENNSSLYYAKLGAVYLPGDSSDILPNVGLGMRFQRGYYGFDISANFSSLIFVNYASLKGMFLFYPQPEKKHQLYFGVGPGVGGYLHAVPAVVWVGGTTHKYGNVTLEGVVGYEFRHSEHFKTFIQLEVTQPIYNFRRQECRYSYKPGLAISCGIGF